MKLNEIISKPRNSHRIILIKGVDFLDRGGMEPFDVDVEYDYEGPSHSDHPYQQGTAREQHGSSIKILRLTTHGTAKQVDGDEKVVKTFPTGTDVQKLPGWEAKKHINWFVQKVEEEEQE